MTFTLSPDDIKRCREISLGNRDLIIDIVRAVSDQTGIPVAHIQGTRQTRPIAHARWLVSYLAHVEGGFTVAEIGRVLRKDHSTICHGIAKERARRKGEGRAE